LRAVRAGDEAQMCQPSPAAAEPNGSRVAHCQGAAGEDK
jgi:hypothetical protein